MRDLTLPQHIHLEAFYPDLVNQSVSVCKQVLPKAIPFLDDAQDVLIPMVSPLGDQVVFATCDGLKEHKEILEKTLVHYPKTELVLNIGQPIWEQFIDNLLYAHRLDQRRLNATCVGIIFHTQEEEVSSEEQSPIIFPLSSKDLPKALQTLRLVSVARTPIVLDEDFLKGVREDLRIRMSVNYALGEDIF